MATENRGDDPGRNRKIHSSKIEFSAQGISYILSLGHPRDYNLGDLSEKQKLEIAHRFFRILKSDLADGQPLPQLSPKNEVFKDIDVSELENMIFETAIQYYTFVFDSLLEEPRSVPKMAGIDVWILRVLDEQLKSQDSDESRKTRVYCLVLFIAAAARLAFVEMFRTISACPPVSSEFEEEAHTEIFRLFELSHSLKDVRLRSSALRLLRSVLAYSASVYSIPLSIDDRRTSGPYLAIRLDEIAELSSRSEEVLKRYGEKSVEGIFEEQLSLVFQSFGLFVVPAQRGRKNVDLLCISPANVGDLSFLVEAKTCSKAYALPAKDSRALSEYISSLRSSLTSLPEIKLAIVISAKPSRTIRNKIKKLESEVNLPIRFVSAEHIVELRSRIPGGLPVRRFVEELVIGDPVASRSFVDKVVEVQRIEQKAHEDFVDSLLRSQG